ncbi:NnrU family protein [Sulfitobacter aestuariivivens]|uniref:NnrU family protein n=1 Tax=Sulfitobacter aestuariivivens TaxID=2766981 RepID=A0A927D5T9_9RHOB|nr:NnrU family protein [Sulfitobacter aestuariivivens]MBD3664007.1 NnrU family protein [Sulfitobacter aestuariivivens]
MFLIILGLILWAGAHFFKRAMPEQRARMGEAGKGLVTVLLVAAIILMVLGYRGTGFIHVWSPPAFMVHINNALMVFAFWTFGSSAGSADKVWPANKIRHPQLTAFKTWAIAHLLVNGDLASILLFGGLLAWAVASVIVINKAQPDWTPPATAGRAKKIRLFVITVVLFVVVALIHLWLGVSPFPS